MGEGIQDNYIQIILQKKRKEKEKRGEKGGKRIKRIV
jgi:hypothetical protein